MTKTFIFGHKNPDTDAISSALIKCGNSICTRLF